MSVTTLFFGNQNSGKTNSDEPVLFDRDLLLCARNCLPCGSRFYQKLDEFRDAVRDLPPNQYRALGKEALYLVKAFYGKDKEIFPESLTTFTSNCQTLLKSKYFYLKNIVLSLAAAAFTALLVATIGFACGFFLGLWSGPLAFFTGIATSATVTVLFLSGASGIAAGLLTSYGLFKEERENPQNQALDELIQAAADVNTYETPKCDPF